MNVVTPVQTSDRKIVGDPGRAAAAIIDAVQLDDPPLRLPLHEFSVESTRHKLEVVARDIARMEQVARSMHYAS